MKTINPLMLKASLTEDEVMEILSISKDDLEMLCRRGELARFKFNNPQRYEYMPSSLQRYIDKAFEDEESN